MKHRPLKHTWIIGASSGIGAALAEELATRGEILCLSARHQSSLDEVKNKLPNPHKARHLSLACDVSDYKQITETLKRIMKSWERIDRIIFMAGLYQPASLDDLNLKDIDDILDVNLKSAFYLLSAVLPMMEKTGGQITLCASVAGYRGLPNSQPYGASKAGLINLAETLRAEKGDKIDIKLINPGFVETRLTDKNDFPMPMKITARKAAHSIAENLDGRKFEIHFPKTFTLTAKLLRFLPDGLYFRLMKQSR